MKLEKLILCCKIWKMCYWQWIMQFWKSKTQLFFMHFNVMISKKTHLYKSKLWLIEKENCFVENETRVILFRIVHYSIPNCEKPYYALCKTVLWRVVALLIQCFSEPFGTHASAREAFQHVSELHNSLNIWCIWTSHRYQHCAYNVSYIGILTDDILDVFRSVSTVFQWDLDLVWKWFQGCR